ncbi:hypothetical protein HOV93_21770 [Planctomycetes bacterium FF15]|uniref:Uncharacterized protein n=2 Tax=Bremerella alba TaxID=980252 RepID=A0A7V8V550_9BACT|nr:hypothetical protein [Bremerella alba]
MLFAGVIEDYVYDELNRLDVLTHYAPDATPEDLSDNDKLAEFDYEVRADGKRTGVTETYWLDSDENGTPEPHVVDIDWTYDELGRLVEESIDHFDNQFDQTEWFEYDLVGSRTKKELDSDFNGTVDEAISYLYDANDRLQTEERDVNNDSTVDVTTTYDYDHTQQTSKSAFDNLAQADLSQTSFTYDLQGRLYTATVTSFTSGVESRIEKTTYDYDASGIRVSALHQVDTDANGTWDETTSTEYLVDHQNFTGYQQVIKETVYDENGNVIKTITYNFGHDEISQTVTQYDGSGNVTSEETHIFGHDGHGSVKVLYDAAAAILQVYTYEAYGQMLAIHNAIAAVVSTGALTSLQYSGEQFDSRIGQQYLRARYYDPNSGRFNRLDPFAGNSSDPQSFHKYLYTHGNPVMGVDPSGEILIGALAGLAVGNYVRKADTKRALTGYAVAGAAIDYLALAWTRKTLWAIGLTSSKNRSLTADEKEVLEWLHKNANHPYSRSDVSSVLNSVDLAEGSSLGIGDWASVFGTFAYCAINFSKAGAVTIGGDIYFSNSYTVGKEWVPSAWSANNVSLLAHETTHSLQANSWGLDHFFGIYYLAETIAYGYRESIPEIEGYAMQAAVDQLIAKYPNIIVDILAGNVPPGASMDLQNFYSVEEANLRAKYARQ